MTNTPPEVLEKWRKDYLNYLDSRPSSINDLCASDIEAAFIAGRQTAVVVLPDWSEYNEIIESQGYRVEVKGEQ